MNPARRLVLAIGSLNNSHHLREILNNAGFLYEEVAESDIEVRAPDACCLMIPFRSVPEVVAHFRRTKNIAWSHGLLLLIIIQTRDPGTLQSIWSLIRLDEWKARPGTPIDAVYPDWPNVAIKIVTHDPGPRFSSALIVEPLTTQKKHRFLLARAFSKFAKVRVRSLVGGKSGAQVYSVVAYTSFAQSRPIPYLAKIDAASSLKQEEENFRRYFRDHIPFNHRPNIIEPLSCFGPTLGILVENFVERAIRFDVALPAGSPSLLLTSVFEGALRGWRLLAHPQLLNTAALFRGKDNRGKETGLVRYRNELRDACESAGRLFHRSYGPKTLLRRFDNLPTHECLFCAVHGDFHSKNIFVASGSTDCFIIDYGNAGKGPATMDPACLEVDLIFSVSSPVPGRFLKKAYQWPLTVLGSNLRHSCDHWLWEAVRTLRQLGGVAEGQSTSYGTALAAYLLRLSRLNAVPLRKRAVAVCVAEWLISKLQNEAPEK